jgi:kynureninase
LVLFSGVQYYTGQLFDLAAIAATGREQGAIVGLDLAHAVGNVPLRLHEWGVDFACWCSYKYLNSGPGSVGGCFVHERHGTVTGADGGAPTSDADVHYRERLAGWWGHRSSDRFKMAPEFIPCEGAYGYRVSNGSVLNIVCVRASLDLFDEAGGMEPLRHKSVRLTGYLEHLLKQEMPHRLTIITPSDPTRRGAQLSIIFDVDVDAAAAKLASAGVICDVRRPNVIRVAPTPFYNSFTDVYQFVKILKEVL